MLLLSSLKLKRFSNLLKSITFVLLFDGEIIVDDDKDDGLDDDCKMDGLDILPLDIILSVMVRRQLAH